MRMICKIAFVLALTLSISITMKAQELKPRVERLNYVAKKEKKWYSISASFAVHKQYSELQKGIGKILFNVENSSLEDAFDAYLNKYEIITIPQDKEATPGFSESFATTFVNGQAGKYLCYKLNHWKSSVIEKKTEYSREVFNIIFDVHLNKVLTLEDILVPEKVAEVRKLIGDAFPQMSRDDDRVTIGYMKNGKMMAVDLGFKLYEASLTDQFKQHLDWAGIEQRFQEEQPWTQDVITYQFQKNDKFCFTQKTLSGKGKSSIAKVQMVVQEVEGQNAKIEFKTTDVEFPQTDKIEDQEMIQRLVEKAKMLSRTVILFESGEPKKVLNMEEIRAAIPALMNEIIEAYKKDKNNAESAELLDGMVDLMAGMLQKSITDETQIKEFQNYVLFDIPRVLGNSKTTTEEGANIETSLKVTNSPSEFDMSQTTHAKYDKEKLQALIGKKGEGANAELKALLSNELVAGILSLLDGMEIHVEKKGIVCQNGTPKKLIVKVQMTMSAMGETETETETIEIIRE